MRGRLLTLALLSPFAASATAQEVEPPLPLGEQLLSERNCVACHRAPTAVRERLESKEAPRLHDVAGRVAPAYLRAFLLDPAGTKSWTTMPNVLGGLEEAERQSAAQDLVAYLGTLGAPLDLEPHGVLSDEIETGRQLFHSIGCVACHRPQEEPWELEMPWLDARAEAEAAAEAGEDEAFDEEDLYIPPGTLAPPSLDLGGFLARKTTVDALAAFLLDPLAVRPSGHMPDLALTDKEARRIAVYLLRDQLTGEPAPAPGILTRYYTRSQGRPDLETDEPARSFVSETFSIDDRDQDDHFGFVFEGLVEIPETGEWTFSTTSDDGSMLWIDGELLVDNGGTHGMRRIEGTRELSAGKHSIRASMFEQGGGEGLEVRWRGPGMDDEVDIPPAALFHVGLAYALGGDPGLDIPDFPTAEGAPSTAGDVDRGRERFVALGCANCHTTGDAVVDSAPDQAKGPSLSELLESSSGSCVRAPDPGAQSRWALDEAQLEAVVATLADPAALAAPLDPQQRIEHRLTRLRCYTCHRRDELGGVHPLRKEYYLANEEAELGDEGRFPPHLSGVGAKLREGYLRSVLAAGDVVRPYITARMPQFGADNVEELVEWFAAADLEEVPPPGEAAALTAEEIDAGQQLVGRDGLGCIQCHDFAGIASLGVRAVDLERMYERLRPGWFRKLLADPKSVGMNSRMAELFVDGKSPAPDLLDGDRDRQIDVVWRYLSLGGAMPYPAGLVTPDSEFELTPIDGVLTCGVFLGDESPRSVMVGFPARVHYAFDVQSCRVTEAWRGRFFNARGTWEGRAGQLEKPASDDVRKAPPGMTLARLESDSTRWPEARGREAGFRPLGRSLTPDGQPTWRYRFGQATVTESVAPVVRVGGGWLARAMEITVPDQAEDYFARLAVGDSIVQEEDGVWAVTDAQGTQRFRVLSGEPQVRLLPADLDGGGKRELLLPVAFDTPAAGTGARTATLEWEWTW